MVQVLTIAITMPTVTIRMVLSIVPAKRAIQEMEQTVKVSRKYCLHLLNDSAKIFAKESRQPKYRLYYFP